MMEKTQNIMSVSLELKQQFVTVLISRNITET